MSTGRDLIANTRSALVRVFRKDPCLRAAAAYLGLASLPYLLPFLDRWQLERYTEAGGFLILIPAVLLALQYRLEEVRSQRERRFWNDLTIGYLCWWVAEIAGRLVPPGWRVLEARLVGDGLMGLSFLAVLLAIARQPHRGSGRRSPADLIEPAGAIVLTFGCYAYFVLIPSVLERPDYLAGLPSLLLIIVLGVLVAARLTWLAAARPSPGWRGSERWRLLYGVLGAAFALRATLDLLEALALAGHLPITAGPRWMILWHVPFAAVVLAARLRHLDVLERREPELNASLTGAAFSSESGLTLAVFSLPAIHLGGSLLDLLSEDTRPQRELVTLLGLLVLGSLMLLQRRSVGRASFQQNSLLGALIESSPLAIVLLDAESRVVTCNPAFESLFVYSRSELVGEKLEGFIATDETRPEALENVRAVLGGETVHRVTRRTRRDGSPVDVRLFGIPLVVAGRLVGAFGLYQDISQQKQAEQQLRDSEERFRRLAEATFEGLLISVDGKIIDANEQVGRILGFPLDQIIGSPAGSRVAPESRELVRERMRAGYDQPYEIDGIRKDGRRIRMEVRGREMPYKGTIARVTALRDITDRRLLEEQLRQSQKMEAIGRLAAGIAHDFNNLLTVIIGRSMLLVDQLEPGSQPWRDAEEIAQAAERATHMTGQLLTFGRRQGLEPRVLDLNDLVAGVEKMLGRLLPENIELKVEPAKEPALVEADPVQLEQVLLNLVINAQDAMPEGGLLTIEVLGTGEDTLRAAMGLAPAEFVGLEVRDNGVGMDEETRARAFEPFFTTKAKDRGTGLGLATVYGIVRQAGGGVVVDSRPGAGTELRILLPRSHGEIAPARTSPAIFEPSRGSHTVLVVEDVQEVCRFVAESLRLCGYQALTAEHPRRALATLESFEGEVDLLLTDVAMPEMDGFALAEKVRELRPGIRVLFMSGYTDSPALRRQGDLARATLLRKPFTHADLAAKIAEALSAPGEP